MFAEIVRAPADDTADRADPGGDEAAVGQLADPDREIEMLFQEIDHAVGQHGPDVDIGIGFEELDCDRENVQTAENTSRARRGRRAWFETRLRRSSP